jgi:2-keto-4-pentenoate hydratase/2-oxohepta-3-ene-1,7-dioic acid hydratase in catechol pathway
LAIGEWTEAQGDNIQGTKENLVLSPSEAIARASKVMTIRQGDLIYIQVDQAPREVHKEDIIRVEIDGEEKLYCKIK